MHFYCSSMEEELGHMNIQSSELRKLHQQVYNTIQVSLFIKLGDNA